MSESTAFTMTASDALTVLLDKRLALFEWIDGQLAGSGFSHKDVASVTQTGNDYTYLCFLRNKVGQRYAVLVDGEHEAASVTVTVTATCPPPVDIEAHMRWLADKLRELRSA